VQRSARALTCLRHTRRRLAPRTRQVSLRDQVIFGGARAPARRARTSVLSVDPVMNGSLWRLPAGAIQVAVGAQYRKEALNEEDAFSGVPFLNSRNVVAGFAEFSVPIVGPAIGASGVNRLELSLADRYEHYSDFGTTNNPKIGITWWPDPYFKVRGSLG